MSTLTVVAVLLHHLPDELVEIFPRLSVCWGHLDLKSRTWNFSRTKSPQL